MAAAEQSSVAKNIAPSDLPPANARGFHIDESGKLAWLRKNKTGRMLTTEEVVEHVPIKNLVPTERQVGKRVFVDVQEQDAALPPAGRKCNVIVGTTGSGKTSAIRMMAGGMRTPMKSVSDTQAPTVYLIENDVAILDTAGLCDTGTLPQDDDTPATRREKEKLKELLMTTVAGTVKKYNLSISRLYLCVPMSQRIPPTFFELWPSLQNALGGASVVPFGRILMTMANQASSVDAIALDREREEGPTYLSLKNNSLGWKLVECGEDNLDAWKDDLVKLCDRTVGVDASAVTTVFDSESKRRNKVTELQNILSKLNKQKDQAVTNKEQALTWLYAKYQTVGELEEKLRRESERDCPDRASVARYRSTLASYRKDIQLRRRDIEEGTATFDSVRKEMDAKERELREEAEQLQRLSGYKDMIGGLLGMVTSAVSARWQSQEARGAR